MKRGDRGYKTWRKRLNEYERKRQAKALKPERKCIVCKTGKLPFPKHSHCIRCKPCKKLHDIKLRKKREPYMKKWVKENKTHLKKYKREYGRKWRMNNPEKHEANKLRAEKRRKTPEARAQSNKRSKAWKSRQGNWWRKHEAEYTTENRRKRLYGEYANSHRILVNLEKVLAKQKKKARAA